MQMIAVAVRHRNFRLLWGAQAASGLGDWAGRIALGTLVYTRTHSAGSAALVVAVSMAAWLGPGQLLATLGDRYSRRSVLVGSDIVRCAAFAAMVIPQPTAGLIVLAGFAGLASPPFAAARAALVPDTVPREEYPAAIGLTQVTDQLTIILGYAVGGVLLATFSSQACLLLNAASFAMSAAFISRVTVTEARGQRRVAGRLALAARAVLFDRPIRLALLLTSLTGAGAMAAEALVVPLAREQGGGAAMTAVFAIAVPLGTVLATFAAGSALDPYENLRRACALGAVGGTAGLVLFLSTASAWALGAGLGGAGVVFAIAAPTNAVIGPRLPAELRSSAFGLLLGVLVGSQALGAAAGGLVANSLGARVTCAVFLSAATAVAVICRVACVDRSAGAAAVPAPASRTSTSLVSSSAD